MRDFEIGERVCVYGDMGTLIWSDHEGYYVEFDKEELGGGCFDFGDLNRVRPRTLPVFKKCVKRAPRSHRRVL